MCMSACVHVYVSACECTYVHVCMCACVRECMRVYVCACVHVRACVCMCVHASVKLLLLHLSHNLLSEKEKEAWWSPFNVNVCKNTQSAQTVSRTDHGRWYSTQLLSAVHTYVTHTYNKHTLGYHIK